MTKLMIGTTGDYPPFSQYSDQLQHFVGFDIELIEVFAKHYDYKIKYTKTTWPDFEFALESGDFDIAVGGVSLTKERWGRFLFSLPIIKSRKVVLTHVENKVKCRSIHDINTSSVSVIFNPGGTNEKFVKQYLFLAKQVCEPEIEDIFKKLARREVDIMITDEQEAAYRSSMNPNFKQINLDDEITVFELGFLFAKSQINLQKQLNTWLSSYLQTDEFRKLQQRLTS